MKHSTFPVNILPYDGEAFYFESLIKTEAANAYLKTLVANACWKQDEFIMFGKRIVTSRKVAWYGDEGLPYTYSKTTRYALPWSKEILEIKNIIENTCARSFNSCLLNMYHNGSEGMGWHSDNEKELGDRPFIASLSLGAARRFVFRHKSTGEKSEILLSNGSLLLMNGDTQSHWVHSLPKSTKVKDVRVNLTYRNIVL